MEREKITDFSGRILGYVEHKLNGDKVLSAFSGAILGFYFKSTNQTQDFYGRIVGYGDVLMTLLK